MHTSQSNKVDMVYNGRGEESSYADTAFVHGWGLLEVYWHIGRQRGDPVGSISSWRPTPHSRAQSNVRINSGGVMAHKKSVQTPFYSFVSIVVILALVPVFLPHLQRGSLSVPRHCSPCRRRWTRTGAFIVKSALKDSYDREDGLSWLLVFWTLY